jgi:hypothetical protein
LVWVITVSKHADDADTVGLLEGLEGIAIQRFNEAEIHLICRVSYIKLIANYCHHALISGANHKICGKQNIWDGFELIIQLPFLLWCLTPTQALSEADEMIVLQAAKGADETLHLIFQLSSPLPKIRTLGIQSLMLQPATGCFAVNQQQLLNS